ncbi:glycoside hydrolase family protein [Niabella drilacis]|uniref:Glycosyl hydrolase family 32 n=1 Tax=Niabella drilacis (strain DSM 25811 / CCM 8410 / CCUG 62505 / LMG 26954 / E90) TaxID=1285928 RepID=A0A1G6LW04_NIADE|nr:hypothetical protein [Niabella drilacis]SDC47443.1 hypothetical protein SAMN04487894_102478 [Niabella drilacis]
MQKRHLLLWSLILFTAVMPRAQTTLPLPVGSNRELFVDSYLIDRLNNVTQQLHHPHNEGPVLKFDNPWEGNFSAYCTIIKDGDRFKLYYRGIRNPGRDGNDNEVTCYAESADGINWIKPRLGIYTVGGTKDNNVVLAHVAPATHNFSPFLDANPNAPAAERYKAVGGTDSTGLFAFVSADGIHWKKKRATAVFKTGVFDSQNVAFWSESEKQYVCYFRTWSDGGFTRYKGFRSVSRTTSRDFINWSAPVKMTFGNTPLDHLYTQQTSPYFRAPQIYLAIGARFMPKRQVITEEQAKALDVNPNYFKDCSDAILMSTRGGSVYDRTFMESYIRPGIGLGNWVSRSNYPVLNVVQTSPSELSIYVNEHYAQPTSHINRYSLRIDGFASLHGDFQGGTAVTKPFIFKGRELEINYATSAAGFVKVELLDEKGSPVPGYTVNDAQEIIGNEIARIVSWKGNTNLSALAGKAVRLKFYLKDADLYALKFN